MYVCIRHSTSKRYVLTAIIYHLGASRLGSYYRAALFSAGKLSHVTDDGRQAAPATAQDLQTVSSNAYVCFLDKPSFVMHRSEFLSSFS